MKRAPYVVAAVTYDRAPPPRVEHRERGCSCTVGMQCAIISATRHWAILQGPAGVVNASRRPSEATTTGHAPKYRKFTAGGLLQGFSAGKGGILRPVTHKHRTSLG